MHIHSHIQECEMIEFLGNKDLGGNQFEFILCKTWNDRVE